MTHNEYTQLLYQLPEHIRKEYGFNEPFDYSPYKCIHTKEYDYYPELDCCIIDDIPIVWESGNSWVTPENPEILAKFKELVYRQTNNLCAFIDMSRSNQLYCQIMNHTHPLTQKTIKEKGYQAIPFTEGNLYYISNKLDLLRNDEQLLIAECLFTAHKYNTIYIIPEKNVPPTEWQTGICIGDEENE
jgi:hypothetical protein